ncbi:Hsp20/alpha crystallin family protein [Spirosoma arcticum]
MATLVQYNRVPAFVNPFYSAYGRPAVNRVYAQKSTVPAVNVRDTETAFQLEVAAPGLKKDALKLTVEASTLTIAYQPETGDQTAETFTRHEFGVTTFTRSFRLPKHVNIDQITAAYTDGILTVTLPKVVVSEEKVVKEIAIA